MTRTLLPRAIEAGATVIPNCRVRRLLKRDGRVNGVLCRRAQDGEAEDLMIRADHVFVCAGAIQTPALLHRSGIRAGVGSGLKVHPMIKIAARFPHPVDHGGVPMQVITEFWPNLSIDGSASRRGQVAMALADSSADYRDALQEWEHVSVYYAAIRSEGYGRVTAVPGLRAPIVTYRLTEGDMSRLARGLVHLGEVLLASGATELYPSVADGPVVRSHHELAAWWDAVTRNRTNLMTVHLTSSVRMGEERALSGADSFGRVWDFDNLRVSDASLVPDAPGVNPQGTIMAIAARNSDHFLAEA
jgi:choline dehydrogenase-like flavoprotein